MLPYRRPEIDHRVFRDADGRIIPYGHRWGGDSPPEDTFSVDAHPERFAPLHTVASALIDHLRASYDVDVDEGDAVAEDLLRPRDDSVRAVRIRPEDADCTSLTFVFTAYPGVVLHAGLLHDFAYPVCGCDACDSTWETEADDLERTVFSVIAGGYREAVEGEGGDSVVEFSLTFPDGATSGRGRSEGIPIERLDEARRLPRTRTSRYAAWPPRRPG